MAFFKRKIRIFVISSQKCFNIFEILKIVELYEILLAISKIYNENINIFNIFLHKSTKIYKMKKNMKNQLFFISSRKCLKFFVKFKNNLYFMKMY